MVFDITDLDDILIVQSFYANGGRFGFGALENNIREYKGEKETQGISIQTCRTLIDSKQIESYWSPGKKRWSIDYVNGLMLKITVDWKKGRKLLSTESYDVRMGKYSGLKVLLDTFLFDEFSIAQNGYSETAQHIDWKKSPGYSKDESKLISELLKEAKKVKEWYGTRWYLRRSLMSVG